jgi:rRNA-processing protein FCF1
VNYLIVDTSSIIFGFSYKNDVFGILAREFPGSKILISAGIINELSGISQNLGKRGASAKLAIKSLRFKKIDVDNSTRSVDSWIYEKSQKYPRITVITNDTELYKKLKTSDIKVLKLTKSGLLR